MRSEVQIFPDPPDSFEVRFETGPMGLMVTGRGHSSAGRAPALQAGGRRFDPVWLHQFSSPAASMVGKSAMEKEHIFSFADFSFFNNLEISDVLTGSIF